LSAMLEDTENWLYEELSLTQDPVV
uniref:Heat shock 70 kDa protein 4L (Fragments) n=1 Tax=Rattus norvegicus TaxID=10116 RepID=HS74L_RAT|nr:RecName: Full=Heat shock 70 kDa protein 4L; AltName: Full=Heat shock 70-related protein APG-1; AltName: Full=Osmotic stress protein 94 [Rattus norvegicus]